MNCYTQNTSCSKDMVAGSDDWGMQTTCCTRHGDILKKLINEKGGISDDFLEDYLKIYILFEATKNEPTLTQCMTKLATHLTVPKFVQNTTIRNDNYSKLSVVLAEFEKYCWFPPNHEIFIGFVPTGNFQDYIAKGLMPKDPGAGVLHGDFTHRLQWHAISRIITREFSTCRRDGWKKTPLELYTSLGRAPATTNNVWFKLLDEPSQFYRHPDNFHNFLKDGGKFGLLSDCLKRRYESRRAEFDKNFDQAKFAEKKKDMTRYPNPTAEKPDDTISAAKRYWGKVQGKANEAYTKEKTDGPGFHPVAELPVLKKSGVEEDSIGIEQRIRASRICLNVVEKGSLNHRAYSAQLGMVTRKGIDKSSMLRPRAK